MIKNITLERPLVFFDLETTGTDIAHDRIVEISISKYMPDGSYTIKTRRFNPGIPIPPEATAVHGISDEDVKDEPLFAKLAPSLALILTGCDLAGYNILRFDLPLLAEEFLRSNVDLPFDENTKTVDAMKIFHKYERRDLTAAVKFYCGEDHSQAHAAEADVIATESVLSAQIDRYGLPNDIESLHDISTEGINRVDLAGNFMRDENGTICFSFGKHKGKPTSTEPEYLNWMLRSDFPSETKIIIKKLLL